MQWVQDFRFMKWFADFKIMTKILSGFILVALLAGIIGLFGIINIKQLSDSQIDTYNTQSKPLATITNVITSYYEMRTTVYDALLLDNESQMKLAIAKVTDIKKKITTYNELLDKTWTETEKVYVHSYQNSLNELFTLLDAVVQDVNNGDRLGAINRLKAVELNTTFGTVAGSLDQLVALKITAMQEESENNKAVADSGFAITLIIMGLCLLLSIGTGIYTSFMISRPIVKLTKTANKLALGEVDVENIKSTSKDEVGILSNAFQSMIENVKEQADAAAKIAGGDLDIDVVPKSENDVLANSMCLVIGTLQNLILEVEYLLGESRKGNYHASSDIEKYEGAYRSIIDGVNKSLASVSEKIFWYEEMLDSIPFPITVTDLNMNVTFINKSAEELVGLTRTQILGKHCSDCWQHSVCNTQDCVIEKFKDNESRAVIGRGDLNYQVDTSYLYDTNNKAVGYIEVFQDVTARSRILDYQKEEVRKLSENLKRLAMGDLKLDLKVADGDEYTVEERSNFEEINRSVSAAVGAISGYIKDISEILNEMAAGNLNVSVKSDYKGDFVEIKDSLNTIITAFNEVVDEINNYADQVAAGSKQVSDGSQALSQGATEQASSVEELTASITEVAAQTKQNALNANQANELAIKVKSNAADGDVQMQEMLVSMEDINTACRSISKIIKVIDEIAFQTNILALNASVEAARAGQHGKGFAVVAEEVRNLAARSAKAANETTDLIENSLSIVEQGAKKAVQTSDALKTVIDSIEQELVIVEEIAKASDEQANAIAQINRGIEQVSKVVQNNSSTAEQSAAASEELSSHADVLKGLTGKFKTNRSLNEEDAKNSFADLHLFEKIESKPQENEKFNVDDLPMVKIDLGEKEFGKY